MKKAFFIRIQTVLVGTVFGSSNPFGAWPFSADTAEKWEKTWTNFNKQMDDLKNLQPSLPPAARPEVEEL